MAGGEPSLAGIHTQLTGTTIILFTVLQQFVSEDPETYSLYLYIFINIHYIY